MILKGLKEIARAIGVSVSSLRHIQRTDPTFPVHRQQKPVVALYSDLCRWAGDTEGGRILIGWQAIADFLGICKETARSWAKEHGLPVKTRPVRTTTWALYEWIAGCKGAGWREELIDAIEGLREIVDRFKEEDEFKE